MIDYDVSSEQSVQVFAKIFAAQRLRNSGLCGELIETLLSVVDFKKSSAFSTANEIEKKR